MPGLLKPSAINLKFGAGALVPLDCECCFVTCKACANARQASGSHSCTHTAIHRVGVVSFCRLVLCPCHTVQDSVLVTCHLHGNADPSGCAAGDKHNGFLKTRAVGSMQHVLSLWSMQTCADCSSMLTWS